MTWGDVFNRFLARGHDHGSAAYEADRWEKRMVNKHWKEWARRDDWHKLFVGSDIRQMIGRIEELEAALRFYANEEHWKLNGRCDPNSSRFDGLSIARAALDKDASE